MENKFNMDSLYRTGVSYISREEEEQAISIAVQRNKPTTAQTSMDVKETDYESLAFLTLARILIDDWIAFGDVHYPISLLRTA